jgi:hypothetical protein
MGEVLRKSSHGKMVNFVKEEKSGKKYGQKHLPIKTQFVEK